ncbi:LolA family protein [Inhella gelatinilytica]|uniref:Outer membrane lipoprotein carrier protein LolA n=1 Tax=Inhella gelatinilytica TaxID=2795030 RepID=A0A931NDM3_9BURK|nr:outer membrane lipoprotein carrier protein LolA [Inhella gelatinilytica]MBH9551601.1 outer membrane lipoprotein carrier protein LolA [Inhella gelatinilytica]
MKRRTVCWALGLLPPLVRADTLSDIGKRLHQPALARGRFEQERWVSGFAKPIKSTGDYLLLRGKGLIWRTLTPFASQLALTREAIRGDAVQLEASKEPSVRVVTQLMLALLDGDLVALGAQFHTQAELVGDKGWRAQLQPRHASLAKLFQRIELDGDRQLRRIQLLETQGDRSLIRLDDQARAPAAPSPEEARALA